MSPGTIGSSPASAADSVFARRLGVAGLFAASAALLALMAFALRQPATGPRVGEPAPDFQLTTYDGDHVHLAELSGRPVVVNFWASWCVTCADEAAELESIWREYRDRGVVFVGVDYTDTDRAARAYLEQHGASYPNGPDEGGRISRAYRLTGVPETFVVDAAGRLAAIPIGGDAPLGDVRFAGPIVAGAAFGPDQLRALLDRLLAATPDRS